MQTLQNNRLDKVFSALADPTRRAIIESLSEDALPVRELAKPFNISLPAISRHLRVLEWAGLIIQQKEGNMRRCIIQGDALKEATAWLSRYEKFWDLQLDSLVEFFKKKNKKK